MISVPPYLWLFWLIGAILYMAVGFFDVLYRCSAAIRSVAWISCSLSLWSWRRTHCMLSSASWRNIWIIWSSFPPVAPFMFRLMRPRFVSWTLFSRIVERKFSPSKSGFAWSTISTRRSGCAEGCRVLVGIW